MEMTAGGRLRTGRRDMRTNAPLEDGLTKGQDNDRDHGRNENRTGLIAAANSKVIIVFDRMCFFFMRP